MTKWFFIIIKSDKTDKIMFGKEKWGRVLEKNK